MKTMMLLCLFGLLTACQSTDIVEIGGPAPEFVEGSLVIRSYWVDQGKIVWVKTSVEDSEGNTVDAVSAYLFENERNDKKFLAAMLMDRFRSVIFSQMITRKLDE